MTETRVLRFPITGKSDAFYLVQVSSNGSKPLDLKLTGTEGEASYVTKLRHKRVNELKASSGHCSDEEWELLLSSVLLEHDSSNARDIEIKADIQSGLVTLHFRKNIQGITQRLGSVQLKEDADEEIDIVGWCVQAIGSRQRVVEDLAATRARAESLEASTDALKAQLEELIKAKEEDERQLLEKFRDLLNEKKLKIRQQQRLLASANVDPSKLENIGTSQKSVRKAKESRNGKRKAGQEVPGESDDGLDTMDVDVEIKDEQKSDTEEMNGQETTDEGTQSEAQESDEDAAAAQPSNTGPRSKTKSSTRTKSQMTRNATRREGTDKPEAPPPPRSLPFQPRERKAEQSKSGEDDTDSDDEL